MAQDPARWLLLIHQIPPTPSYFRVKIWRHLLGLGAVALKNSVYVLPRSEEAREDFQWVVRQIAAGGGEASVVEARFVEGLSDGELRERFRQARDEDYAKVLGDLQAALTERPQEADVASRAEAEAQAARLRKRLVDLQAIDFFGAKGQAQAWMQLGRLEERLRQKPGAVAPRRAWKPADLRGRTWVTRKGIHVDRIACAWLIRRFVDPAARFRFVDPATTKVRKGELRFDMFEGEFTHEGDRCSFETFLHALGIEDPALHALAEVIHDVDLKDGRYQRPEAAGFARAIHGVALMHGRDEDRLAAGTAVLEAFYAAFRRSRP